jgi:hypothetical protein
MGGRDPDDDTTNRRSTADRRGAGDCRRSGAQLWPSLATEEIHQSLKRTRHLGWIADNVVPINRDVA